MTVWKVDGIVAQKHKQRSKAVVLSDSPNGVEWGMGNLMGSIEDGFLVWRNRTGQVMYEWGRCGPESVDLPPQPKKEPKSPAVLQSKGKCAKETTSAVEEPTAHLLSPRSTSSTVSTAPTDAAAVLAPGAASIGGDLRGPAMNCKKQTKQPKQTKQTKQTTQEVAKLLEMAGSRLASGDYGAAMQYVLFAQTLDPLQVKGLPSQH
jgi:hypothetical protein